MQPETGYATLGDDRIAYQVIGDGPIDVILGPGTWGAMDTEWERPEWALFYRRWASFCRLIRFDPRGAGASDPVPRDALPPWERAVAELIAVMDACNSKRAVPLGFLDGGPAAMLFATTMPDRTAGLILNHTAARHVAADDYPIGMPPAAVDEVVDRVVAAWGTGDAAWAFFPSEAGDERFRRWFAKFSRAAATPGAAGAAIREMLEGDSRSLLDAIHVPTLILHRTDYEFVSVEHARYLAEHIQGAKLVELPGTDAVPIWEDPDSYLEAMREFLAEIEPSPAPALRPTRIMATVLFTDIVRSTERAEQVGDREWRDLLDLHDEVSRSRVGEFEGQLVKTTGDGILATFDGPGRGIRCAATLRDELGRMGLSIRSGLHAGELERRDGDIGGHAVSLAARVMAAADAGEVFVSRTVRDLVVGSDLGFEDRGSHPLKGIGDWELFALAERRRTPRA